MKQVIVIVAILTFLAFLPIGTQYLADIEDDDEDRIGSRYIAHNHDPFRGENGTRRYLGRHQENSRLIHPRDNCLVDW